MEVYRNQPELVQLNFADLSETISVDLTENGRLIRHIEEVGPTGGHFYVQLDAADVTYEKTLLLTATHSTLGYKTYTEVEVVNPYLTLDEVRALSPTLTLVENTVLKKTERMARYIVNAYVGHDFSLRHRTLRAYGTGDVMLDLSMPLVQLDSITGGIGINSLRAANGNLYFTHSDVDALYYSTPRFKRDYPYVITGLWGYFNTPEEVKDATAIVISDALCRESVWRDKYINYLSTDGLNIRFDSAAFVGTGNVKADEILMQYKEMDFWLV